MDKEKYYRPFYPVREVGHLHIYEIAFEGIAGLNGIKGCGNPFSRIFRWRKDKNRGCQ